MSSYRNKHENRSDIATSHRMVLSTLSTYLQCKKPQHKCGLTLGDVCILSNKNTLVKVRDGFGKTLIKMLSSLMLHCGSTHHIKNLILL